MANPYSETSQKIYDAVRRIPEGRVATYGQIAALCGNPRMARVVGNVLHVNPYYGDVPCHRVVNAAGKLSGAFAFGSFEEQKNLLQDEGVEVLNYRVDLETYGWKPEDDV